MVTKINTQRRVRPARKGKLGPRIVHAWFTTVINPIINGLKTEQTLLEKKDWTWMYRPGNLEFIKAIRGYVPSEAADNLDHFTSFNPDLEASIQDHDQWVTHLFVQCKILQRTVEESSKLSALYRRVTSRKNLAKLGTSVENTFGGYPRETHLWLLAQYIVNNTERVPDYYYTARLWNAHRDEFLAILDDPEVAAMNSQTEFAGKELLLASNRLSNVLRRKREKLSLDYDVPYVTLGAFSA